jgi:GNAT superfamily N-acetyltransferase
MNKEVECLKKENIDSYINFIRDVFDYEADKKAIQNLIKKHKVLIIRNQDKIIASVVLEECFEYIKNQKYYHLGYFGVLKEYRRMGYANRIFESGNGVEKQLIRDVLSYVRAAYQYFKPDETQSIAQIDALIGTYYEQMTPFTPDAVPAKEAVIFVIAASATPFAKRVESAVGFSIEAEPVQACREEFKSITASS